MKERTEAVHDCGLGSQGRARPRARSLQTLGHVLLGIPVSPAPGPLLKSKRTTDARWDSLPLIP